MARGKKFDNSGDSRWLRYVQRFNSKTLDPRIISWIKAANGAELGRFMRSDNVTTEQKVFGLTELLIRCNK